MTKTISRALSKLILTLGNGGKVSRQVKDTTLADGFASGVIQFSSAEGYSLTTKGKEIFNSLTIAGFSTSKP